MTFLDEQEARDTLARFDNRDGGDFCRRWSTCGYCATESAELEALTEQDAWEADHLRDCTNLPPARTYDEVTEDSTPAVWPQFTHRMEPAGTRVTAAKTFAEPFAPHRRRVVVLDLDRGAA